MPSYSTVNPSTGETLSDYNMQTSEAIDASITRSASGYTTWSQTPIDGRSELLNAIAQLHRDRKEHLAEVIALEMGKPIEQGRAEVEQAATIFEYYAQHGPELLKDEPIIRVETGRAVVRTAPIGPVLGVMPWNFPYYQVARFVAPNLLLGNTVLLKHARACTQASIEIAEIIAAAGAPTGVYENLIVSSDAIADVIADDRVRGVSLTGSEEAGRSVAIAAGQHLKKCVLELGGSDPFIVLPDADVDSAVEFAERGRFLNAGQACNSAKRMIVHSDVWDHFVTKLVDRVKQWQAGDPLDEKTRLGPLASASARRDIEKQVDDAVSKGATVLFSGDVPVGNGAFYPATILTDVTEDMRAYQEELFGPVAVLYRVASVDEAVHIANDSPFGLGAVVFTENATTADAVANRLEVGMVGLNTTIRSQPNLPFGGVKASGIGRELGRFGLEEFSNKKLLRYV